MSGPVVCGVDLTERSPLPAAVAAVIARALGCQAAVAHVDDESPGMPSVRRARALRELRALADDQGFAADTLVWLSGGDPAETLVRMARDHDAELLVVGSRGRGDLRTALGGSVSAAVVRAAPCPVAVVPPRLTLPFPHPGLRSVICGVEGSERDRELLRFAADLAGRVGAPLYAVHGFDPRPLYGAHPVPVALAGLPEAARTRLARSVRAAGVRAHRAVVPMPAASALCHAAEAHRAGLVVVASSGRGRLGLFLHGSIVMDLQAQPISCPVVVLPRDVRIAAGSGHYELNAGAA
jgi:nucleotide-binding universal stress UspA family protein